MTPSLHLSLPTCWGDLAPEDLVRIAPLYFRSYDRTNFLLRLAITLLGLKPIRPYDEISYLYLHRGQEVRLSSLDLARSSERLSWMLDGVTHDCPCIDRIGRYRLGDPRLRDRTFREFSLLESTYSHLLSSSDLSQVPRLVSILYRMRRPPRLSPRVMSVFLWYQGFRDFLYRSYPDLYTPTSSSESLSDPQDVFLAQLRALTGGDITKNTAVLNAPLYEVLSELNAKSLENKELKKNLERTTL